MSTFPNTRVAVQPSATIYTDAGCRTFATVLIDGVPQSGSLIVADSSGLWPLFDVADAAVVYYRTPAGRIESMLPAIGANITAPIVISGSTEDNPALVELINALVTLGLPIVNSTQTGAVVTSVSPDTGTSAGGTQITIIGYGLSDATGVEIDGDPVDSFEIISDTEIRAITASHAGGTATVNLVVTDPDGNSAPVDFDYVDPAAEIDTLSPTTGGTAGGTAVTVNGSWFGDATAVTFGGTPGTSFTVVNDGVIEVDSPAHAAGAVDVIVESPNGDSDPATFTYA